MDSVILKFLSEGGPVALVLAIIGFVLVRYVVPLVEKALTSHTGAMARLVDDHRAAQNKLVDDHRTEAREAQGIFRETLKTVVEQNDKMVSVIDGNMKQMRGDLDRLADDLSGIRQEIGHITGPVRRSDEVPPSGRRRGE